MNKSLLIIVFIVSIAVIIIFHIYTQNTRYYIQTTSFGRAYKIDRKTGKTWLILGGKESLIESQGSSKNIISPEQNIIPPEEKAIELAREEVGEYYIKNHMEEMKGDIKIIGWKAREIENGIYLASYTYIKKNSDYESGIFLEVQLDHKIVRYITGDPELEEKYGLK